MKIDHSYTCVNTKTGEQKSSGGIGGAGKYCTSYTYTPGNSNFAGEQCHGSINSCSITVDGHTFNCTTGTYEYDGVTYNVKRIETSGLNVSAIAELQECSMLVNDGGSSTCAIKVVAAGDTSKNAYCSIHLTGNEVKNDSLSNSNSYKVTWNNLECGKQYFVRATDGGNDTGPNTVTVDANPTTISSLTGTQTVTVTFGNPGDPSCGLTFTSSGDTGGAAEGQCTVTSGKDNSTKTVTLSKGTQYKGSLSNLYCGYGYTISCSGTGTGSTYKLTPSQSVISTLTGTQNVDVKFEKGQEEPCKIVVRGGGDIDPSIVMATVNLSGPDGSKTQKLDSSSGSFSVSWDLTCGANYTISLSDLATDRNGGNATVKADYDGSVNNLQGTKYVDVEFSIQSGSTPSPKVAILNVNKVKCQQYYPSQPFSCSWSSKGLELESWPFNGTSVGSIVVLVDFQMDSQYCNYNPLECRLTKTFVLSSSNTSISDVDFGTIPFYGGNTLYVAYPSVVEIYANAYGGPSLLGSGYENCSVRVDYRYDVFDP